MRRSKTIGPVGTSGWSSAIRSIRSRSHGAAVTAIRTGQLLIWSPISECGWPRPGSAAHEDIITAVRSAIGKTTSSGDWGSNDLLIGDVPRRHELQVWFLSAHLVDIPRVDA
jgi:hypothetical protein